MATLAELRSGLRVLLKDAAAEGYLWSDAALDRHLNDAVRDYSRSFPRQREATIATMAGQREYDLPADCLAVVGVEVVGATGRSPLREGDEDNGDGWPTVGPTGRSALRYQIWGGKLILLPTPTEGGQSVAVRYLAPHACLSSEEDLSTVPAADEDLLLAFACAEALRGLSAEGAKRQQFEQRAGGSAEAAAALYQQRYERGIRDRGSGVRVGRLVDRG